MKPFTLEWWMKILRRVVFRIVASDRGLEYAELANWIEQRIIKKYEFIDGLKPMTPEFLSYLLVNALRNLNEAQRHNLAISLAVRDPLFTVEEYEMQCEKPEKNDRT